MRPSRPQYRLALLMLIVVIPGLIISGFGIISISQQEKTREISIQENYSSELKQLSNQIQNEIETAINKTFQQFLQNVAISDQTGPSQQSLKELLLENPIAKYPFIISPGGNYIFPSSGKSTVPLIESPLFKITSKKIKTYFQKGEQLEFRERNYIGAIQSYLKCLEIPESQHFSPYIYNVIGRCYYKLGKYPQSISYYNNIINFYSKGIPNAIDFSLYFPVLRQIARIRQHSGLQEEAVRIYLRLYDEILQYETSHSPEGFAFYKNEALEYLNQHLQVHSSEGNATNDEMLPGTALSPNRVQEFTKPEISLRWQYFEYPDETGITGFSPDENRYKEAESPVQRSGDYLHFLKIREFYLSADEKTQFYKAVKELDSWKDLQLTNKTETRFFIKHIRSQINNDMFNVVFKSFPDNSATQISGKKYYSFGFRLSPDYLNSPPIQKLLTRYQHEPEIKLIVQSIQNRLSESFPLISINLDSFFPERSLVLLTDEQNFFINKARREIRLNYILMSAFILILIAGVFLFYKYLSREAELVRLKSEFTDQASHSLKTPLTRIRMIAEKLQLGWVSNETKKQEYLGTILIEADRMNEMIVNMLDFSRIEAGKKQYHFESQSLPQVVSKTIETLSPYLRNLGFQLNLDIDESLPLISLDSDAIQLILINLLQNAVKYSKEEKNIYLRLFRESNHAIVEVEDKGIGFDKKESKRIFDRFYRSPVESVQTVEGSGLGLFLVQHAVKAHHGEIQTSSQPGKGSCFRIVLPISPPPESSAKGNSEGTK